MVEEGIDLISYAYTSEDYDFSLPGKQEEKQERLEKVVRPIAKDRLRDLMAPEIMMDGHDEGKYPDYTWKANEAFLALTNPLEFFKTVVAGTYSFRDPFAGAILRSHFTEQEAQEMISEILAALKKEPSDLVSVVREYSKNRDAHRSVIGPEVEVKRFDYSNYDLPENQREKTRLMNSLVTKTAQKILALFDEKIEYYEGDDGRQHDVDYSHRADEAYLALVDPKKFLSYKVSNFMYYLKMNDRYELNEFMSSKYFRKAEAELILAAALEQLGKTPDDLRIIVRRYTNGKSEHRAQIKQLEKTA